MTTAELREHLRRLRAIRRVASGKTDGLDLGIRTAEAELARREAILARDEAGRR